MLGAAYLYRQNETDKNWCLQSLIILVEWKEGKFLKQDQYRWWNLHSSLHSWKRNPNKRMEEFNQTKTVQNKGKKRSAGKVLLTVYWDMKGVIAHKSLRGKQTVNSLNYVDFIGNKLKPAFQTKRRGYIRRGILLQYDIAGPHRSSFMIENL